MKSSRSGRHPAIIPRRRFTGWAALYAGVFVIIPFLALCALADYGLYLLARRGLIGCWSLFCLFD